MPPGPSQQAANAEKPRPLALMAGVAVALLCAILALLRPMFHDEASTLYFSQGSASHLWEMIRQDIHPPGYFLLAWAWLRLTALLGSSQPDLPLMALRLLSSGLMGASVAVFIKAVPLHTGRKVGPWSVASVAVSPFLVFCGYFARYYSLTCLLWSAAFFALGAIRARERSSAAGNSTATMPAALFSLSVGALWLVNYAAAVLAVVGFLPMTLALSRRSSAAPRLALIVPALSAFIITVPLLWMQLSQDLPQRLTPGSGPSVSSLAKNAAFLLWTLAVGDGMPPWSLAGLAVGPLLLSATALMLARAGWLLGRPKRRSNDSDRAPAQISPGAAIPAARSTRPRSPLILMAGLMIAAGATVGWVLLPGAAYSFLPPRVALCGFAWLLLSAVAADTPGAGGRWYLRLLFSSNLLATGCLLAGGFTNWAYVVPARQVAVHVAAEASKAPPPTVIYLPEKSMRNILYYIDQAPWPAGTRLNPDGMGENTPASVLVLRQTTAPSWPPSSATQGRPAADPPGQWHLKSTTAFLQEPAGAARIKRLLAGRDVYPHKITVDLWVPTLPSEP